jgi:transcriptional antiterminator RfaH
VQTKPKCERTVAIKLELKNYQVFYPVYRERRRWSDRCVELERPLFPGYIFCRTKNAVFGSVIQTPGVRRILGFGAAPAEIPADEVEALRRINTSDAVRAPWPYMRDGTRVCIESGPFKGVEGLYSADSNHRRLILSVTLIERSVGVILDPLVAIRVVGTRHCAVACR